ncbi:hypothetical protein MSHOH_1310 [Methanosarcina horonobensis HB-1 = JCM 15518]|uniref:Uncharacterized protein n=1 Tax=Methanosarcina horonobensis HB-1 = JCM 15518 TaxID=1434110 RepID=A0A0E3SE77_9EURY|nr:hypothetical protein MSHOH_1310 [Methanosarcina horonobensis HB-1 = JCM 15518]
MALNYKNRFIRTFFFPANRGFGGLSKIPFLLIFLKHGRSIENIAASGINDYAEKLEKRLIKKVTGKYIKKIKGDQRGS